MSSHVPLQRTPNIRHTVLSRAILTLCRLVIAVVFAYAGVLKAIHPGQLFTDIQHYQLVSDRAAWLTAGFLPYLEIFAGCALLVPQSEEAARWILLGLTLAFIGALISAWARGLNINCGCFGYRSAAKPNYVWWLTRDVALIALLTATSVCEHNTRQR